MKVIVGLIVSGFLAYVMWKIAIPMFFLYLLGVMNGRSPDKAKYFAQSWVMNRIAIQLGITILFVALALVAVFWLGPIWGGGLVAAFTFILVLWFGAVASQMKSP